MRVRCQYELSSGRGHQRLPVTRWNGEPTFGIET